MTDLDDDPYAPDTIDDDVVSRMIDDLFVEADDRSTFGWALPDGMTPDETPAADAAIDVDRKRAVRAFGHQIRLTRRSAGFRTTGELAFAMRTVGVKITGATIGNWERGFVLPDPQTLNAAEQVMRTGGALLDSLHELIGNDEAAIEPEVVEAGPDVHTRLRIEDLETRVADLEDEVDTLRGQSPTPRPAPRQAAPRPPAPSRRWLSRLRTAPTHHHSPGSSLGETGAPRPR